MPGLLIQILVSQLCLHAFAGLETVKTEVRGNRSPPGLQLIRCHGPDVAVNLKVMASGWKEVVTW